MSNPTGAYGLMPLRYKSGAPYNGACNLYLCSGATALYIGDPVVKVASSNTTDYYGMPAGSIGNVTIATAAYGNRLTGVIVGFFPEQATSTVYNPASTVRGVYVADDPNLVFSVRDNGAATPLNTWVHANADLVAGSGSAYTNKSGWAINGSTVYVGAASHTDTAQLRILRLRPDSSANTLAAYAEWEVQIKYHTEIDGISGY
jgi:hypothetical protein